VTSRAPLGLAGRTQVAVWAARRGLAA
jgi:hypothetical protein